MSVFDLISLCAWTSNCHSSGGVEYSKVNSRLINEVRHKAAQRIDFSNHMPLTYSSNTWITTHLTNLTNRHSQ